jgi:hypothetical protein
MSKKILILTPLDGESMRNLLSQLKEEFKTLPIEMQAPVLIADMVYKQMKKTTERSYFHCFLASIDSYRDMNEKENVFLTTAPIKLMIGASSTDILYHEVWVYNMDTVSAQEYYIEDYMIEYEGALDDYLTLYKSSQATRRFSSFKSLLGAISKELSKEMDNEL